MILYNYFEAVALASGQAIKGYIWRTLLAIWSCMLIAGLFGINPPLLEVYSYEILAFSLIIAIDYFNDKPQIEVVAVWLLLILSVVQKITV